MHLGLVILTHFAAGLPGSIQEFAGLEIFSIVIGSFEASLDIGNEIFSGSEVFEGSED